MNFIHPTDRSFRIYREKITEAFDDGNKQHANYLIANLALEELKVCVQQGNEPTEEQISIVESRFDEAALPVDNNDDMTTLRAGLLRAWIRPVVWSGILNLEGLGDAEARNATAHIQLVKAGDETADLVHMALAIHDEIEKSLLKHSTDEALRRNQRVNGFLHEALPIQIGVRHNTSKLFMVPSAAFDDQLTTDASQRVDGFMLDNRRKRSAKTVKPYQVGLASDHERTAESIPIITGRITGNIRNSILWPNDERDFGTSRRLVTERRGRKLSQAALRTLDSIGSVVENTISHRRDPAELLTS